MWIAISFLQLYILAVRLHSRACLHYSPFQLNITREHWLWQASYFKKIYLQPLIILLRKPTKASEEAQRNTNKSSKDVLASQLGCVIYHAVSMNISKIIISSGQATIRTVAGSIPAPTAAVYLKHRICLCGQ